MVNDAFLSLIRNNELTPPRIAPTTPEAISLTIPERVLSPNMDCIATPVRTPKTIQDITVIPEVYAVEITSRIKLRKEKERNSSYFVKCL